MVEGKFGLAAGEEFTEAGAEHNSGLKPGKESDDDNNDYDYDGDENKIMMMMVMKIMNDDGDDCDVPGVTFVNRPLARQLHISNP